MNIAPFEVGDTVYFGNRRDVVFIVTDVKYKEWHNISDRWRVDVKTEPCPHCGVSKEVYYNVRADVLKLTER